MHCVPRTRIIEARGSGTNQQQTHGAEGHFWPFRRNACWTKGMVVVFGFLRCEGSHREEEVLDRRAVGPCSEPRRDRLLPIGFLIRATESPLFPVRSRTPPDRSWNNAGLHDSPLGPLGRFSARSPSDDADRAGTLRATPAACGRHTRGLLPRGRSRCARHHHTIGTPARQSGKPLHTVDGELATD